MSQQQGQDKDTERNEEPTAKRLEDARKKGDVVKSVELLTATAYGGFFIVFALGGDFFLGAANLGLGFFDHADSARIPKDIIFTKLITLLGLLLLPGFAVLGILLAQRAIVFSPDKLKPKLSRISPISNARQKFGGQGFIDFLKNVTKLVAVGTSLWIFLSLRFDEILMTAALNFKSGLQVMFGFLGQFLLLVIAIMLVIGGADILIQKQAFLRRNRMSRKEVQDEIKDTEGDPNTKSRRRQRGQELALNQMLNDVPEAAVVIVNPTHYAVALKWERGSQSAPVLVAKGVDEVAHRIREKALEAGVPIHSDPPIARAIHGNVEIGQTIAREHYIAVAAAIRFAENIRRRAQQKLNL